MNDWAATRDIKAIENLIKELNDKLLDLAHANERARAANAILHDEHYKDNELANMKERMDEAIKARHNGFPLTAEERQKAYDWQIEHDTTVHDNPKMYHGASGGGYEWVFYPTGLGTTCDCICSACKRKAIAEAGIKWYDKCKEMGGVCEVIGWEAF